MPDLSGRRIGNYQLASKVGQGGMAVVYQGMHVLTGETVAVKVLSSQAADEANFARRFSAEARRFFERKKAKTNNVIATKALAHKLARACYHVMKEKRPFDVTRCFARA